MDTFHRTFGAKNAGFGVGFGGEREARERREREAERERETRGTPSAQTVVAGVG